MTDMYEPDQHDIRYDYVMLNNETYGTADEAGRMFDRWLTDYTREKQAEAWYEGFSEGLSSNPDDEWQPTSPYDADRREEQR